jgi:hypothetical protein
VEYHQRLKRSLLSFQQLLSPSILLIHRVQTGNVEITHLTHHRLLDGKITTQAYSRIQEKEVTLRQDLVEVLRRMDTKEVDIN